VNLIKLIDPKTDAMGKERICFLWKNQYCELDSYKGRYEGITILKVEPVETAKDTFKIHIPSFIAVEGNITGNPQYNERSMAMKQKKKT
jgi:CYTH domain-containing protein